MSDTLALAASIATMDRDQVARLLTARTASAHATDPLALATELLRPDALNRTLSRLPGSLLQQLRGDASTPPTDPEALRLLGLLGLADRTSVRLTVVTSAVDRAFAALEERDAPPAPEAVVADPAATTHDAATWYAPALTATAQVAECVRSLQRSSGRLNRNGSIAVATVRGLAETIGVSDREAQLALETMQRAGFLESRDRAFVPSPRASAWLRLPYLERWSALSEAVLGALPSPLRETLAGALDPRTTHELREHFPLLSDADLAASRDAASLLEYLGLSVGGSLTVPGRELLDGDSAGALETARRSMPQLSPGVYVQPDLSLVVPGPLAPSDEAVIAELSEPEQIGVASTRRITERALLSAFERGVSPERASDELTRISLTGMPQPLAYLLQSLAERSGAITLSEHHGDEGRTRISVANEALAERLLLDRALNHLHLQRGDATTLFARLRAEHVLAALTDARHPATLTPSADADTTADPDPAQPAAPAPADAPDPAAIASQAARIVEAAHAAPGDFTRRIELAVRDRAPITVSVSANGVTRQFRLLPMSLDSGRLRALDQTADVERTLPVNLITAVD